MITASRKYKIFILWILLASVFTYGFHRTFFTNDVHHIGYPGYDGNRGWKSKIFAVMEDVYQTSMTYIDFKGDDCKGCLTKDYKIILNPRIICEHGHRGGKQQPRLLLLIFTTFGERPARDTVRKTWLSASLNNTGYVRYVFLLGKGQSDGQQEEIVSESQDYSDILQHDYVECVRNMTLKTISAFKWVTKYCPDVQHIMKVDTDIWLNIPKWEELTVGGKGGNNVRRAMVGHCRHKPAVVRFPLHRYFVSEEAYPKKRHPNYCRGPAYYLSRKLVTEVVNISYSQPYIAVEDAYVGHCLERLGYGVYNPPNLVLNDYSMMRDQVEADPCAILEDVYTIHKVSSKDLESVWERTRECLT